MTRKTQPDDGDARIKAIAIEWVIRENMDRPDDTPGPELQAWLDADPRHARAFRHAAETWAGLDILAIDPGPLRGDLPPAPPRRPRAFAARLSVAARHTAALGACAAVAIGFTSLWYGNPVTMLRADYRTGVGEMRVVTLEDGSRVQLGPNSAIAAHFSASERHVELFSGVAAFTAVPKAQAGGRPFVVDAANGEARALGTRFVVDRLPGAVTVTVTEHKVRVSASGGDAAHTATVLAPGQQVRYDAAGVGARQDTDVTFAAAWQRGRLIVDSAPLGDAVAQFNRYRHGRIVLAGTALASRRVSGIFDTADIDGAVTTIADELHLRSVRVGPLVTVLY